MVLLPDRQRWYAKWKLSSDMCTLHTRLCTFGADLYAQSVLSNKIPALELSWKFIKSALLVGYLCHTLCIVLRTINDPPPTPSSSSSSSCMTYLLPSFPSKRSLLESQNFFLLPPFPISPFLLISHSSRGEGGLRTHTRLKKNR